MVNSIPPLQCLNVGKFILEICQLFVRSCHLRIMILKRPGTLRIFDAEFPYKRSCFEPLCLPAKMAAETVNRPIELVRVGPETQLWILDD